MDVQKVPGRPALCLYIFHMGMGIPSARPKSRKKWYPHSVAAHSPMIAHTPAARIWYFRANCHLTDHRQTSVRHVRPTARHRTCAIPAPARLRIRGDFPRARWVSCDAHAAHSAHGGLPTKEGPRHHLRSGSVGPGASLLRQGSLNCQVRPARRLARPAPICACE